MYRRRALYKKKRQVAIIAPANAVAGNAYCSDGTIIAFADIAASGKTVIGNVVSNVSSVIRVLALTNNSYKWAGSETDITALTNITNSANAIADINGINNTDLIIAQQGTANIYAAQFCKAYATAGTSAGQWYFPSCGEVKQMLDNYSAVQAGRIAAGGDSLSQGFIGGDEYSHAIKSSTEYSAKYYWYISMNITANTITPSYFGDKDASESTIVIPMLKITY
jgi:hypothetical protein